MGIEAIFDKRVKHNLVKTIKLKEKLKNDLFKEDLLFQVSYDKTDSGYFYTIGKIINLFPDNLNIQGHDNTSEHYLDYVRGYSLNDILAVYRLPK